MFHREHLRIYGVASGTYAFLLGERWEREGGRRRLLSLCNRLLVANKLQSHIQSCTKNLNEPLQPLTISQRTYPVLLMVGDPESEYRYISIDFNERASAVASHSNMVMSPAHGG